MAGKRLLDVAALLNGTRGVAQKYVALRKRQLDVYSQTSSLAKAVKTQTDRFTETARAASFLASRFNEGPPARGSELHGQVSSQATSPNNDSPIPSTDSTQATGSQVRTGLENGLLQDHFYDKSEANTSTDPVSTEDLSVEQETASRHPLPDGTIPAADSRINATKRDHDTLFRLTQEPAKDPVTSSDEDILRPASSRDSTIPLPPDDTQRLSSTEARRLQRHSENQIPSRSAHADHVQPVEKLASGHDEDIFYEPSQHNSPVFSSLPRVKIPKQTQNIQGNDEHMENIEIDSDSFSSPTNANISETILSVAPVPGQDVVPEGVNTDLFYSPRVAKLLGERTQEYKKELRMKGVKGMLLERTELAVGKDQDTVNVRSSSQTESSTPNRLNASSQPVAATTANKGVANNIKDTARGTPGQSSDASAAVSISALSTASYEMRESRVPSSRLGRLWNYGGLAAGMFGGAVTESLRRATGSGGEGSYMLSAANMDRLVAKLSRMRGAALKLGQMMSFQDSKMLPLPIQQVLLRVQDSADYMPPSQRNRVLAANLGPGWRDHFDTFDEKPIAAASIGQVHSAVLKATGERVAVKVQYPGVAGSIDSDLSNIAILLTASRLLPKGLYLDKTISNARTELGWECDYLREAECGERFRSLLSDEPDVFVVPKVYAEASGKEVLTMTYMEGIGVTKVQNLTQEQKDWIGTQILRLCLREITEFRFMQTDPNWTNFLFNDKTNKLELLDFGASREYPEEFIMRYTRLLLAASKSDKDAVRSLSVQLGYLTGHESKAMLNAHIASVLTLAEPFLASSPETYNFRDQTITDRVKSLIPVMVRERLAPPPEETYSLHRKLSGAFLLCARLESRVRCRDLFEKSMITAGFV